ncbi:DNA cytosine methyltransferase [Pseudomonas viridiflava]|uniref:DNA cytosine methyltransferase n=1 Tax=Pseudomonas viridiflava TaxID=33069 RepID=UPI000F011B6B|nr:DNA cytosine methyltransferase [Pseudomonas viridiflava]
MAVASFPREAAQGEKITGLRSIELFAGAGGLGIGFSNSGVHHEAVVELSRHACETLRINKRRGVHPIANWADVTEGDVRDFSFESFEGLDLVTGGPPCQPFSMGGKHRGFLDERDMFPQAVRAIREVKPKAFVFENVKGLTRSSFYNYFNYIQLQLEFPSLCVKNDEEWLSHLARLEQHRTGGGRSEYHVVARLVNAANYGVPQKRERVFFVGFREDVHRAWTFPEQTHSADALLYDQWVSGEYWDRHRVAKRNRPEFPIRSTKKIESLKDEILVNRLSPWSTVRDAISDLPDPELNPHISVQAHRFQPGARSYPGHTGSPMDEPAKALKAGDHGVPGGENMLRRPDGTIRYFTVRECARIQTFPDEFIFEGSWGEIMRQLGNAVPVRLARTVADRVCEQLRTLQG